VTADELAPGAVAFPNSLWGRMIRNQQGAAQSNLQAGPGGRPQGTGSLRLLVTGAPDLAAFGDSLDFAGSRLADITDLSYSTYNAVPTPRVRPSLRMEINPHLVDDTTTGGALEFTTLTYEPAAGTTGWTTHSNITADNNWFLTGSEGTTTRCTQAAKCTFTEVTAALNGNGDPDTAAPAITTGVYFTLGAGVTTPTETAVDKLVLNNFCSTSNPWACSSHRPPDMSQPAAPLSS
jgi:hypothetical protein